MSQLPIPRRKRGDPDHDYIVDLAAQRVTAAEECATARTTGEQDAASRRASGLDDKIEREVERLFGVTTQEAAALHAG